MKSLVLYRNSCRFSKQQAGLGGMAFDEGTFGVFGYITKGLDIMYSLRDGATITSAKVLSGGEKLVRPQGAQTSSSS